MMMDSEEMFTIDDAENDGLIKREVGKQMASNLKRSSPQIWQMLENVCESQDLRPQEVLGDHALRAIRSQEHSEMLADIRVDMSQVNKDQIRIQDAQFIQELSESLGLDEGEDEDPIDRLIQRRLEAKAGPMLPGGDRTRRRDIDKGVQKELDTIKQRMGELQERLAERGVDSGSGDSSKSVDDLFDGDEDEDVETDGETEEDVVVEEDVEAPDVGREEPDPEDGVDVDEFLEEDDSSESEVDELFGDGPDEDEGADGDVDDIEEDISIPPDGIPNETDDGTDVVSSEGGATEDE